MTSLWNFSSDSPYTHTCTHHALLPCSPAELSSIILTKSIWIPQLIPGRHPDDIYSPPSWWKSTVNLSWLPALGQVTLLVLSPPLTHITIGNSHAPFFEVSIQKHSFSLIKTKLCLNLTSLKLHSSFFYSKENFIHRLSGWLAISSHPCTP